MEVNNVSKAAALSILLSSMYRYLPAKELLVFYESGGMLMPINHFGVQKSPYPGVIVPTKFREIPESSIRD